MEVVWWYSGIGVRVEAVYRYDGGWRAGVQAGISQAFKGGFTGTL